jgi:hypothetical protein
MDIRQLFRLRGVSMAPEGHHHTHQGWINVNCPFCPRNQSFHLGFNLRFHSFHCWKCGRHEYAKTMALITGMSISECLEYRKLLPRRDSAKKFFQTRTGTYTPPKAVRPMTERHRNYIKNVRRLDPDEIERTWGVQGIGVARGSLAWRLFLPIFYGDRPVSWTTRSILRTEKIRYYSAKPHEELFAHKTLLYGEDLCDEGIVIVHEGPIDVWTTGPGAVCTFGIDYTPVQLARIASFPIRAICYDNTPDNISAFRRSDALVRSLSVVPGVTYQLTLSGKDSNSSPREEIREMRYQVGLSDWV